SEPIADLRAINRDRGPPMLALTQTPPRSLRKDRGLGNAAEVANCLKRPYRRHGKDDIPSDEGKAAYYNSRIRSVLLCAAEQGCGHAEQNDTGDYRDTVTSE